MTKETYVVLGLGNFGMSLARTLQQQGIDVIGIDRDMDKVESVAPHISLAVQADFTKYEQLHEVGLQECQTVIIASSRQLEDAIVGILNLERLGIPRIIVKSANPDYKEVLLRVGADRVILPELEAGARTGRELANTSLHEFISLDEHYDIVEFQVPAKWVNHSIIDLNLRKNYQLNVIAIKAEGKSFMVDFSPQRIFKASDIILGITSDNNFQQILKK